MGIVDIYEVELCRGQRCRRSRIQGDRGASAQRRRTQEGSATRPEAWERKPTAEAVLRLRPSASRPRVDAERSHRQISHGVGKDRKRLEARGWRLVASRHSASNAGPSIARQPAASVDGAGMVDTDDTKNDGKRHRHDTEGMYGRVIGSNS